MHIVSLEFVESLLNKFETNAEIFHKILMSTCAEVSKFGSLMSCKHKFWQKIHSKWKMWRFNFEQKVSIHAEETHVCL